MNILRHDPYSAAWWRDAVLYQVYSRSFADGDGDGSGDLDGLTGRLEHLAWLGVDAVWLNPVYVSPMVDGGYDIADHTDIHPLFGDLAAFDRMVRSAHALGLRVLMDFVPNHTSAEHPWFRASRSSREHEKRDWYFWRDGRRQPDGAELPPNNWVSAFGGSAWTYDPDTQQWYLHTFLPEQPDLDWRNPQVEEAMFAVARFWLHRGVDGFRIDVANFVMKDPELRDNPPRRDSADSAYRPLGAYDTQIHLHDKGHPDAHGVYRRLRHLLDGHAADHDRASHAGKLPSGDRVALAELHTFDWPDWLGAWAAYYGEQLDELHLPLNLSLVNLPFDARAWRKAVDTVEAVLPDGAWPSLVLGSHDEPRISSRLHAELGPSAAPAATRLAMFGLLTLRGTPVIYYGDELGMSDVVIPADRIHDRWGDQQASQAGLGSPARGLGRDPQRTPMPWDTSPNAGFAPADVQPWLPLASDAPDHSVARQAADPSSLLSITRALLALRREHPALRKGGYRPLETTAPDVFAFVRQTEHERLLVVLNFGASRTTVPAPDPDAGTVLVPLLSSIAANGSRPSGPVGRANVEGYEGLVLRIDATLGAAHLCGARPATRMEA